MRLLVLTIIRTERGHRIGNPVNRQHAARRKIEKGVLLSSKQKIVVSAMFWIAGVGERVPVSGSSDSYATQR